MMEREDILDVTYELLMDHRSKDPNNYYPYCVSFFKDLFLPYSLLKTPVN